MSQITPEAALEIAKKHVGTLIEFKITDKWEDGWGSIYGGDSLAGCWYITFSWGSMIGASALIAVSMETGDILYSGMIGE